MSPCNSVHKNQHNQINNISVSDKNNVQNHGVKIITDIKLMDLNFIYDFLYNKSTWAQNIPFDTFKTSIENSLCFGMFHNSKQIGFARLITDYATFGYLCDVFIADGYRNKNYATQLMQHIFSDNKLIKLRRIVLVTADAHKLYKKVGFTAITNPKGYMEIYRPDVYKLQSSL